MNCLHCREADRQSISKLHVQTLYCTFQIRLLNFCSSLGLSFTGVTADFNLSVFSKEAPGLFNFAKLRKQTGNNSHVI